MQEQPQRRTLDIESVMKQERERLTRERKQLQQQQKDIQKQIDKLDNELAAIDAYEAARKGKTMQAPARTRRTGRRQALHNLIKQHPGGLDRAEISDKLDVSDDKREQQSISSALSALKKDGRITQKDGKYAAT